MTTAIEPVVWRNGAEWKSYGGDECGSVFMHMLRASGTEFRSGARILEIGCAEYNWRALARQYWPDIAITGIDWRETPAVAGVTTIRGDVLSYEFSPNAFDGIVSISAIEHIGLGYYNHDPVREDGDSETIRRAHRWLAPGGLLLFDVPWNARPFEVHSKFRVYDNAAHTARLKQPVDGWIERWRGYLTRGVPATLVRGQPTEPLDAAHKQFYYCACVWQKTVPPSLRKD